VWHRRKGGSEPLSYKGLYAMINDAVQSIDLILEKLANGEIDAGNLENVVTTDVLKHRFNPIYSSMAALLLEVISLVDDVSDAARKIRVVLKSKIEKMLNEVVERCREDVVSQVSSLALVGYDEILNECITGAKKLNTVYVLESRPWGDGVREVEFLRSKGIEAILVPDYAIQHVVEESEIALIPVNAVTYDGYALLRTGIKPLLLAFQDMGRNTYGITLSVALLASHSSASIAPNISKLKIYVKEVNEELVIDVYELVNIEKIKYIVTDSGLYEPEELDIEGEAYNVIQTLMAEVTGADEP
jgi:translation initiation factor 2B subunit (eIF-2B alpha/beta/delta family)